MALKNVPAKATSPQDQLLIVFKQDLAQIVPYLETLLPKGGVARFQQMTNLAILRDPKLLECTKISLLLAILWCAQKNLEPGVEDGAWLIPYKGKVVPIPAYKGLINRAVAVGAALSVDPYTVYENDEFYYCYGLEPDVRHTPPRLGGDRGELIGAYVIITLPNSTKKFHVMDRTDMEKHRGSSAAWKAGESGPWADWEDAMFKKTIIKQGLKTVPMKSEMRDLLAEDTQIEAGATLGAILVGAGADIPKELEGADPGPEDDKEPDTSVFDGLVAKELEGVEMTAVQIHTRLAHLHEFLKVQAKTFKKTIPLFKEYVGNQFFFPYSGKATEKRPDGQHLGLWKTFLKWEADNYPLADEPGVQEAGMQEEPAGSTAEGQGEGDPADPPFESAEPAIAVDDRRKAVIRKILEKAIPLADLDLTDLADITIENIGTVEEKVGVWAPAKKGKK